MTPLRGVLGVARVVVGLGCWCAPDRAARFFGIDPGHANRFVTRLFGARDLALGTALLAAPATALRPVAILGACIDSADTVAGCHEALRGSLSPRAVALGPGGAAVFAVLGALVVQRELPRVGG